MRHALTFLFINSLLIIGSFSNPYELCAQVPFYVANSQIYGGSSIDEGTTIGLGHDSTYLMVGGRSFSSDLFVPPSAGGTDYWMLKTNLSGDTIWSRTYGGSNNDDIASILPIENGEIFGFGTSFSDMGANGTLNGITGAWLMKTDSNGLLNYSQLFSGSIAERGVDMVDGGLNGIIVLGESSSPTFQGDMNHGVIDAWVSGLSNQGLVQWSFLYGGSQLDQVSAITNTNDAGYVIAGSSMSQNGDIDSTRGGLDFWVFKILGNGNLVWSKTFGGTSDDITTDIVSTSDGEFIIVGHTLSDDHDISSSSKGAEDLWVIRLDANGELVWEKRFGGSGIDLAAQIEMLSDETFVISATSESIDCDLTGNKGLADYWLLRIDSDGNLLTQMNYGGSQNDKVADMTSDGQNVFINGTSSSIGGTLPFQNLPFEDAWILQLSIDSLICAENFICRQDTLNSSNIIYPGSNGTLSCITGCNIGLPPGPTFPIGNCGSVTNEAAYFGLYTDGSADFVSLNITSGEFNLPYIVFAKTVNCEQFEVIECAFGFNGEAFIQNIAVEPNTLYTIVVSDLNGNVGNFDLCASALDIEFCNKESAIYATQTSLGSPLEGPYQPGEEVSICYELTDWEKLDCNGLQGLSPTFGPGWDQSSFTPFGEPDEIDTVLNQFAQGNWDWYLAGEIRYNTTNPYTGITGGSGMPVGWYFFNSSSPPPNEGPDDTEGDITTCISSVASWKLCFTLTTVEECSENLDCSVSIKSYADGEIGAFTSLACGFDQSTTMNPMLACCLNPNVSEIPDLMRCSGDTTIFTLNSNLLGNANYSWEVVQADAGIFGAGIGSSETFSQILENIEDFPQSVTYRVSADDGLCFAEDEEFTITVRPKPRTQMQLIGSSDVCSGDDITIQFTNFGESPYVVVLSVNGVEDSLLLDETVSTIQYTPEFTSQFAAVGFSDRNCIGSASGVFVIDIIPNPISFIDTTLCAGDSFQLGDQFIHTGGTFSTIIPNSSQFGCDSTVNLSITLIPRFETTIDTFICDGDSLIIGGDVIKLEGNYTFNFQSQEGCDSIINLNVEVTNQSVVEFEQSICFGNSIIFNDNILSVSGIYSDTFYMNKNCFEVQVLSLTVYAPIEVGMLDLNADNGQGIGSIFLETVGGTPPYSHLWDNGKTTESITDLDAGVYTVGIVDANNCTAEFTFSVPLGTATKDEDAFSKTITLHPNPVQKGKLISIHYQEQNRDPISKIELYHSSGQMIKLSNFNFQASGFGQFETPQISGLYYCVIESQEGRRTIKKFAVLE